METIELNAVVTKPLEENVHFFQPLILENYENQYELYSIKKWSTFRDYYFHFLRQSTTDLGFYDRFFDLWKIYQRKINEKLEERENTDEILYDEIQCLLCQKLSVYINANVSNPNRILGNKISKTSNVFETIQQNKICKVYRKCDIQAFDMFYDIIDLHNEFFIQFILYYEGEEDKYVPQPARFFIDKKIGDMSYYLTMEKLDGMEFDRFIVKHYKHNFMDVLEVLRNIILIVQYYQTVYNFVHNDLKPDNIMICRDGIVRLLDFGMSYIEFEGNKIFVDFSDTEIHSSVFQKDVEYEFPFFQYLKSSYLRSCDVLYLLWTLYYYLPKQHIFMRWMEMKFFMCEGVCIMDKIHESTNIFKYFILSKNPEILLEEFPNLCVSSFMQQFLPENILLSLDEFRQIYILHSS